MSSFEDTLYLDNLDGYLYDENRIVTYKWLSRTLEVPVNHAKQMLYDYIDYKRNRNGGRSPTVDRCGDDYDERELYVVYLVVGIRADNPDNLNYHTQLLPEQMFGAYKHKYRVIVSKHVYSVQAIAAKASTAAQDGCGLYLADYQLIVDHNLHANQFNSIKCPSAELRPAPQYQHIKAEPAVTITAKPPQNVAAKQAQQKKAAGGISAMFAQQASKTAAAKADKIKEEKPDSKDTKGGKTKNSGISSFFGKASTTKPKQEPKQDTKRKSPPWKKSPAKIPTKPKQEPKQDTKRKSPPWKKSPVKIPKEQEDNSPIKKRRRIRDVFSSSEDESMEESPPPSPQAAPMDTSPAKASGARDVDEEEDEKYFVPNTPVSKPAADSKPSPTSSAAVVVKHEDESHVIPETQAPPADSQRPSRRGRKMVKRKKTSMDEDGFIVTETVMESTDCSSSDDDDDCTPPPNQMAQKGSSTNNTTPENPAASTRNEKAAATKQPKEQKPTAKKPTKKAAPKKTEGGKKQTALTSFFKKK